MCGHCCQGEGGIVLTDTDRERLADHLGIDQDELVRRYTRERCGKIHLICGDDGYCVFFDQGCGVHPGRPDICRAWPYFRGNLVDETSWKMIQEYCPGINADAGHAEFVRQGRRYLHDKGLLRYDPDTSPNALICDD
ncbi:YkgJ family cysteine cluster protein [Pseudodesulfovibrio sp. F-1]|uniref:YkgJ family cysteine cluster protein n=2 Tax=Pseudodesulfovibrio alkaliphilus TaxID=2661613 RepID=A0A7K1KLZ0_9BACT|nr:YkgJ family cysteine cluster protein [Pseudodesulfovibrio alkaliphilus]MUM77075.1 YkgJ family cysteine cluster protein [Pseudodesulfovibrio alkaliphilus]